MGDWIKATAAYHSRTPKYGNAYLARIERAWNTIVARVQKAQGAQGVPVEQTGYRVINPSNVEPAFAERSASENGIEATHNVKVISVSNAMPQKQSLLAVSVKPAPQTEGPVVATLAPMRDEMLVMGGQNSASAVDKPAAEGNMRKQPNFIFVH
jgi:hypothetical protein